MAPKRIRFHEGRHDAQVANVATHIMAREEGVRALNPPVYPITLLPGADGALDSAFTSSDVHASPIPAANNVPPSDDNEAHEAVRRPPEAIEQMRLFFRPDGNVVQTRVGGPCEKGKGLK
ncbi:MAG: hypothetical protein EXR72_16850 [Myxococcales bacterium]|nr:hypothetical protein [Myxococcales bacterium]